MTYGEKKQLIFHYILRDNREYESIIKPDKMMEVSKEMYSIQESVLLHPNNTMAHILKGDNVELGFGTKLIVLERLGHDGVIIGKACFSRVTGNIYFSVED
jgi:hypothetical protein